MFSEKAREDKPRRKTKAERALESKMRNILENMPEEERLPALEAAADKIRQRMRQFEECPECGEDRLETRFYRGRRRCRACGYSEENKDMIKVLRFMESSRGGITVGEVMKGCGLTADTCVSCLQELGYGVA